MVDGEAPETETGQAGTQRLDAALAARGLARSRTHAARLIADGLVTVDGAQSVKSSTRVGADSVIVVAENDHYVSRAAHKLVAALDGFGVAVEGRAALDVGASTGGFTQVLLERGAASVVALDVGHDQLVDSIASDARVTVIEGFNARDMTPETLAAAAGRTVHADLVVADLSFISLTMVLPAIASTVGTDADFVVLVKPQFEVGRTGIREGIVHDAALRADAVAGVMWAAWDLGLPTAGVISSPILGGAGNHEYLLWLSTTAGGNPTEWLDRVSALCR
ncbi:23S rRNA (cytidine1920-2'-O)/16S rRNA (cytidine1409-2'-O)-methyltransferase [Homoserinimonas aerilata]|uniref:23S rRNA (Cytidine1920-2'-O)/16S rRNA (Cytidine1409-2'-O)-methyltransferase n=1 Tax=Homoserinimonas aerilata TaxID=1162970 RepID=A0A542YJQ2_9MICO|nr:TlyA family RNA methyltransferase [Homoserinimonas aerilata]TQL48325.1 23S rRNA (cytidine1920-2'-O)/16S rRNA (cytidine1409-2'-O)-methyltransferase [Homoserinimonas aerilata]